MQKPSLSLVVIRSRDIDRSAQFYSAIGLQLEKHRHGSGPYHFVYEQAGMVFEIYPAQNDTGSTASVRLGFQVAAVDSIVQMLVREGVTVLSSPKTSPWGRRAVVEDPDGHSVELIEPVASTESRL